MTYLIAFFFLASIVALLVSLRILAIFPGTLRLRKLLSTFHYFFWAISIFSVAVIAAPNGTPLPSASGEVLSGVKLPDEIGKNEGTTGGIEMNQAQDSKQKTSEKHGSIRCASASIDVDTPEEITEPKESVSKYGAKIVKKFVRRASRCD